MRAPLFALLALVLVAGSGCDSTDEVTLDSQYYVGTWTLVSVSDERGDQTTLTRQALDDLTVQFQSDNSFRLTADFSNAINTAGQADITTTGTYQAQPSVPALILQSGGLAATLTASASTEDRVRLAAPAVIINALLRGLPFQFQGDTTLTIERQ